MKNLIIVFSPNNSILIKISSFEIIISNPPSQNPFHQLPLLNLRIQLSHVKKKLSQTHSTRQDPKHSEHPPGPRVKALVPIPQRSHRGAHAIKSLNNRHLLVRHKKNRTNKKEHHEDKEGNVAFVPQLVGMQLLENLRGTTKALTQVESSDEETLLLLDEIISSSAQEMAHENHPGEDEGAREEPRRGAAGDEVAVSDGRHRHDAEVNGVQNAVGFVTGDLVSNEVETESADG